MQTKDKAIKAIDLVNTSALNFLNKSNGDPSKAKTGLREFLSKCQASDELKALLEELVSLSIDTLVESGVPCQV